MSDPIELPIDGELDLHLFHPRDVKDLVPDYLDECKQRGITDVRIIHGKGTGSLRETVHAILKNRTDVIEYYLTDHNWGSTSVVLNQDTES
ncbi:MAG: Smr/MutS family protein [Candidatus Latescibacteria bacterium]|jgi:DNA-nicking Smr family endonuclease|nr:Smr/MutS family protein [Candidatus Latescibacterota bacterium]